MNDFKNLVNVVDGYSYDNTGYMIVEAHKDGDLWSLKVQGYCKELVDPITEDPISTFTLVERFEKKYNYNFSSYDRKWKVLKVEELEDNMYNLTVKKYQEDSKNEENNDPEGKQVEAEE